MVKRGVSIVNVLIALLLLALGLWGRINEIGGIASNLYLIILGGIGYWFLGGDVKSLIKPLKKGQIKFIFKIIFFTLIMGLVVIKFSDNILHMPSTANTVIHETTWITPFIKIPGLFGEEMLVIVLLTILERFLPKNRKGLIIASIISSLIFGACHISAYDWNVWQSLVLIGLTRLPFTYAWYKSERNLLVTGISHWGYDMFILIIAILAGIA